MNPMIAALQNSRSAAPEGPGRDLGVGGAPEAPEAAGPGDAMVEKLASLEAKLDAILKILGADQSDGAPQEPEGQEAAPNDDGN